MSVSANNHAVAGHVFTARFDPRPARRFVGMGVGLFALAALLSLSFVRSFPVSPVLFAAALVFHFWPALNPTAPAVRFDRRGFWLDGLGLVLWEAVERAAWRVRAGPRGEIALMQIDLACPLSLAVVEPATGGVWRKLQTRNWRKVGHTRLVVLFSGLEDSPADVRAAFESFLGHPTGPRGLIA